VKTQIEQFADKQVEALKGKLADVAAAIEALRNITAQGGEPANLFGAYKYHG